jgi:hypothetical protein
MSDRRNGWFATQPQIIGSLENWTTHYIWDGETCESRGFAISRGFTAFECDDFNVGRIEDGRLVWFGWMDEQHPVEDYAEVAAALGLAAPLVPDQETKDKTQQ